MTFIVKTEREQALSSALSDDTAWDRLVYDRTTQVQAREWLAGELAILRTQREQKATSLSKQDYHQFVARQAGYKRLVARRMQQVMASLHAGGENPVPRLRERAQYLTGIIAALTVAIDDYLEEKEDETILEDALDAFTLGMQDNDVTLAEALESLPRWREDGGRTLAEARAKLDTEEGS